MYLSNEIINKKLSRDIKSNATCNYHLINKEWMKKYRDYYDYNKLCNLLDKNVSKGGNFVKHKNKLIDIFVENKTEPYDNSIWELLRNINIETFRDYETKKLYQEDLYQDLKIDLNKKNDFQINQIEYRTSQSALKYYGENEIISSELYAQFINLESDIITKVFKDKCEKIICYMGENKLYIITELKFKFEYHLLTIGYIENLIFKPALLIYYYDLEDFNHLIVSLINSSFSKFIEKYNLIENSCLEIKEFNNNNKTIGKISKIKELSDEMKKIIENANIINPESMKLLNLIVYLKSFNNEQNNKKIGKEQKLGYLVKKEFIEKIQKLQSYKLIDSYISNNEKIENIIKTNNNNYDKMIESIKKEFDINKIKKINAQKDKDNINIKSTDFDVETLNLILDENNKVEYANNFYILNKEIYKDFKGFTFFKDNHHYYYVSGENHIFMIYNKNTIHVYKNDGQNYLELIILIDNKNKRDSILEEIQNIGLEQFLSYSLFNHDEVSPLFDKEYKKIGTAYKYSQNIKDYTKMNINFQLKKLFLLYRNYYGLLNPPSISKNFVD